MINKCFLATVLLSAICFGGNSVVAGGPENAVVVVNSESKSSLLIANHYIFLRNIPASNVIYLKDIPQGEFIDLKEFREKILMPIFKTIDRRGLADHVDYVIYSSGFPTSVKAYAVREKLKTSDDPKLKKLAGNKFLAPELSLTSATFYYQSIIAEDHSFYLSMNSNLYMRKRTQNVLKLPFVGKDQVQFNKAVRFARENKYGDAASILSSLAAKHPKQMAVLYWLARVYAWNGDSAKSVKWLKHAIAAGWSYREYTSSDPGFAELLDDPDFQSTLEFIPNLPFQHLATQSFRGKNYWAPNGSVNSRPDQGARFMLSTMLGVTRNQGNTEQETLRYLQRSIMADGTRPEGTFYFSDTNKIQTIPRQPGFADAVEELRLFGFKAEIIKSILPMKRSDVAGLMIGSGKYDWRSSASKILPGAICESLTSYGGRLAPETKQTKLSEFLRYGAAGSSGTVREPFALQAKFPAPRIHLHYARGCTLAESFYQSVSGPFQLLIVGDALCRPWARIPAIDVSGELVDSPELSGTIKFGISAAKDSIPIQATNIYIDGNLFQRVKRTGTESMSFDTTTIPDGFHEIRIVPISAGTIATPGSNVFPVKINNQGLAVDLECNSKSVKIDETISFTATAPQAKEIRLIHNRRILGHETDSNAQFNVPASVFGRGPVSVIAVATIDGKPIRSAPVQLSIAGELSTKLPIEKSPSKRKKRTPAKN